MIANMLLHGHLTVRSCPFPTLPTAQLLAPPYRVSGKVGVSKQHRHPFREAFHSLSVSGRRHRASQLVQAQGPTTASPQVAPQTEAVPVEGVHALRLSEHTTLLRGICNQRFKYEVEYGLKRGTSDNCYVTRGKNDAVLIDVPDEAWLADFMPALEGVVPIGELTHIIVTHLSPKRIGSLRKLLELRRDRPDAAPLELLLSNPALQLVRSTFGKDEAGSALLSTVKLTVAKSDSSIQLDSGTQLRLIPCPTPRWPDLLSVSSDADHILFSSKLFAAHVAPQAAGVATSVPWDEGGWDVYGHDWQHYFDCMLAPVARQAVGVLERLEGLMVPAAGTNSVILGTFNKLQVKFQKALTTALPNMDSPTTGQRIVVTTIAPLHGPVVRTSLVELLHQYSDWTVEQIKAADVCTVVVMYASAYGNTAALAQALSRGITKAGVGVETLNLEQCSMDEVQEAISRCSGFVIGSPTLGGHMPTQVKTALGAILRESEAKVLPCGVFGSFGWSGEAVDEMEQRLQDAGFKFGFDAIRVKFKPTAGQLQVCEESGTDLAQLVKKKIKRRQSQAAASQVSTNATSLQQAMGRVLGSLCVLTSKDEDAESGMLASWISQASFDPPGLSIAVKKDRAVENLMLTGNRFNINILKEGGDKAIMKQMLKPFKPAQPRFEGLNTEVSEETGAVILTDAAAYLECTVKDRMEAGDHWIVYGLIDGGKVLDEKALAAIHQRKTGMSY